MTWRWSKQKCKILTETLFGESLYHPFSSSTKHLLCTVTLAKNMILLLMQYQLSVFVTSHKLYKLLHVQPLMSQISFLLWVGIAPLGLPETEVKSGSFRSCSLLAPETGAASPARLFLERHRAQSAGSDVFEGPPVPLISQGTPRCERAPSPGLPHCSVLFLYPRSPHSVKLRGTSSISPVPHVNHRFNQMLLLDLPLCSHSDTPCGMEKKLNCRQPFILIYFLHHTLFSFSFSSFIDHFMCLCILVCMFSLWSYALCFMLWYFPTMANMHTLT